MQGNVVAVVADDGEVQERYRYDVQGNIEYLDENFTIKAAPSASVAWQHLFGGMRRDDETGLYFGGGYYHAKLGRFLPSGKISVFGEGFLNSRAAGFPFGTPQPAGAGGLMRLMGRFEQAAQWASEQPQWVKATIGAELVIGTAIVLVAYNYGTAGVNPDAWLRTVGALYGAVGGGLESTLSGGDYGDVMLGAGIGTLFGALSPTGAIGSLVGGVGGMWAAGGDPSKIAQYYQFGSLVGGLAGDFTGGVLNAGKNVAMRAAVYKGLVHVGPDLAGAGVGAITGGIVGGTFASALHGANLGMMGGGIAGGAARGLWGVRRASSDVPGMASGRYQSSDAIIEFSTRYQAEFNLVIGNRMRQLGIPDEAIGIRNFPGVDEGAFTRFPFTQIGGNVNPLVFVNRSRGIALDHGILDTVHPTMRNVPTWLKSRLSDRADAAIIHELIESTLTPPRHLNGQQAVEWLHKQAIRLSPGTKLPISDRARAILAEYSRAMGLG